MKEKKLRDLTLKEINDEVQSILEDWEMEEISNTMTMFHFNQDGQKCYITVHRLNDGAILVAFNYLLDRNISYYNQVIYEDYDGFIRCIRRIGNKVTDSMFIDLKDGLDDYLKQHFREILI